MLKSKYKWQLLTDKEVQTDKELIEVILKNRNINNQVQFFNQTDFFHDPFLFNDMHKTVERIFSAINNKEKIMLYGDYDVDGVTGTAILYKTLKQLNANVDFYIPNRFLEGYGPNLEAFKGFVAANYQLIITIDNGISGIIEADYLLENNVDLIITDHHESKAKLPKAYAIIHPKLKEEPYPFKDLSGCGIAFKLSHALLGYLPVEYVDLACLGTYADIVSVLDENRSIVKMGLMQLLNTKHIGLKTLGELVKPKVIDEFSLGFIFGPRLNAPGRMDCAIEAVKLLITEDYEEALQIADNIEKLNNERKKTIDLILTEAIEIIEQNNYHNDNVIVIAKDDWHEGVLGIVANRLVEKYELPAIVLTENASSYKGSCRTLADFPLFDNLSKCEEMLEKFGGHEMAAGIQIAKDKLDLFRSKFNALADFDMCHTLKIDCLPSSNIINTHLTNKLELFRPYGPGNQKPTFLLKGYEITSMTQIGSKSEHLRLTLKKDHLFITVVAFNMGEYYYLLNENDLVDVVGTFEINEYNGKITNQFFVKDIRCEFIQVFDYRSKQFNLNYNENLDYVYFDNNYGYQNAIKFNKEFKAKNLVIIDLPDNIDNLKLLINNSEVEKIYLLLRCDELFSTEHLLTREKMGKFYQVIKKYQKIKLNDERLLKDLNNIGFDKKIQNIAIQVFFELNFVIIENDEIIILENPEKRNLSESKTFNKVNESIKLREKLLLSSTKELKAFIFNLSLEDKNED